MRITKVTTKKGDRGKTQLGDGKTVSKSDLRIKCIGQVDELNSFIGSAKVSCDDNDIRGHLKQIQNHLLNLGGEISIPESNSKILRNESIKFLESLTEEMNANLPPLKEFVLPGEDEFSAKLHLARSVCRRVETMIVELINQESGNSNWIGYLNRLSDFLFVAARYHINLNQLTENQWKRSD